MARHTLVNMAFINHMRTLKYMTRNIHGLTFNINAGLTWLERHNRERKPNMSTNINEQQKTLAEQLASVHSEALTSAINTVAQAKEDYQGGPVKVYFAMRQTYSEEQLSMFPKPGSGKEKGWVGNNPDYFKMKKPGKDGKENEATVSFYNVFTDDTVEGKELNRRINWMKRVGNPDYNQADIPQQIKDMNPQEREAALTKAKNKLATIKAAYRNAAKLMFQLDAVNSLEFVQATVVPAIKAGEFENLIQLSTTDPARIVNGVPQDWDQFSISNFMRLDADKASENGGTIAALKDTIKRKDGDDNSNEPGGAKPDLIATVDKFKARATDIHEYLNTKVFDTKDRTAYNAVLKALSGPGSDDFLLSIGTIRDALGDFMSVGNNQSRYDILKSKADDQKKAA